MRETDMKSMSVEQLRAEMKKTTTLIGTTRIRLANQERKLIDLKMTLLDKLENEEP